jgi:hypothetical protein
MTHDDERYFGWACLLVILTSAVITVATGDWLHWLATGLALWTLYGVLKALSS